MLKPRKIKNSEAEKERKEGVEEEREGRKKEWRDGGKSERGGALVISSCVTNHSKICSLKKQLFRFFMILWIDWL